MIELKVTVKDEKQAGNLLQELNGREGITARVISKPYAIDDESQIPLASEPASSNGAPANVNFSNNVTHFYDGEKLYVSRRYYEEYIRDMAYNFSHPEEQKDEPLRTISNEELENCITLDELHDELTDMIHKHYHPEA